VLPVEVVVRQFIAGSAWRDYAEGKPVSGVKLPPGIQPHQRLPKPIITPSTKAAAGSHDQPISETEILERGLVSEALWREICDVSLRLFAAGSEEVSKRGLLLVDTKYEFGVVDGVLTLVDEIHTLDSSRYWKEATYTERFERGVVPEMLDKEPTRQWLLEQGFKGDGEIPMFSDEHRVSIARHYISSFELISGKEFAGTPGPVAGRIEKSLRDLISRE
jgi:phosphoribosylaminoimidazole-succinocarboxamide synthase